METPTSQIENRLEGIRQAATIEGKEITIRFEGNVLRFDGEIVINRSTSNLKEALIDSLDALSRVHLRDKVQESIFLILLIQTIDSLEEDGETLHQTSFGRMDAELLRKMREMEAEARYHLARAHVVLGNMVHYDAA